MDVWAGQEMAGAKLPDRRLRRSLAAIAERMAVSAGASFSQACGPAGRQAARRALRHKKVNVDDLLQGHFEQTGARCKAHERVVAIQDTTTLDYGRHRATQGLGAISTDADSWGLLSHSVLVSSLAGEPLGLVGLQVWAREKEHFGQKHERRKRPVAQKESAKWGRGLLAVQRYVPAPVRVLLVQDREADVFAFLASPRQGRVDLLVRATQPRSVEWVEEGREGGAQRSDLLSAAASAAVVGQMSVRVPRKPAQPEREARLAVRARPVRALAPRHVPAGELADGQVYAPQELWLVQAQEVDAPAGVEPIEWVLITTQPLCGGQDACEMVRFYAMRWLIEVLHRVLKSGVGVERLQIDAVHPLMNAIALHYLVAWRLLHLTHLARTQPEAGAELVLAEEEIQVLEAATGHSVLTVGQALTEVAKLGGYEPYRGGPPPGPKVLWRGLVRLDAMASGWVLAHHRYPRKM